MKIDRKSHPVARETQKRGQLKKAHYTSAGGMHLMKLESQLEASAATVMGLDPRVRSIRSQPMTFDLATGRTYPTVDALHQAQRLYGIKCLKYTPDFEVDVCGAKVLVEVKHRELIRMNPKILGYPGVLARYGYRLVILDDVILNETYTRNLRLLNIARSIRVAGKHDVQMVAFSGDGKPYGDFLSKGFDEAALLRAIAVGQLTCDVRSARLNHKSMVSACGDTQAHLKELPLVCC